MTELVIKKATKKPFESSEGETINYFWYKAFRPSDGVTLEFGSTEEHKLNAEIEIELEKIELTNGKYRYKEVVI